MNKVAVGQHHFIRNFLPALIAVLLVSTLALLSFGVLMEKHVENRARSMAQRVAPGYQVALELDLAVEHFALATVLAAKSGDERGVNEAAQRLDSAAKAYDGWASAAHVGGFTSMAPVMAEFEERVTAANPRGDEIDVRAIEEAVDQVSDVLRENRAVAASGSARMLDEIASIEQRRRWEELALMGLVGIACWALLVVARRREERVCATEKQTMLNLERVNADLEAFAGRVAHDLRNPLVPILSGTQVIGRSDVNVSVRRAAERIERSAKRLSSMIDMLLDFSRLTAAPPPSACDVRPIVEDVVEGFAEKARTSGVSLVVHCDDVRAQCEPIVVASPLQNLIENAMKYGRREGVSPVIEIRGFLRTGMVILEVEDRGPGLDAVEAENLFLAFQRGVEGGEGVGLGLATARRLVEARGGSVGLRAGRFGGALFQVRLPAERPPEARHDEERGGDEEEGEKGNGKGVTTVHVPT
jgi:signal transduction histidine kinase